MPYVSEAQRKAMYPAASGHSTIGIPKSVGKDYVAAGPSKSRLPEYVHRRKMKRAAK